MASSWLGWIIFINDCRWLFHIHVGHLKSQCITYSTSPELHSLQVLSSRFTPRHLPISTWRGAVPPRNLRIILLSLFIFIPAHRDSSPHSMMMVCIVDNFGLLSSSSLHFSCTFLHATLCSIPFSSVSDRFWMSICPTFSQSKSWQHLAIFLIHEPFAMTYWLCCHPPQQPLVIHWAGEDLEPKYDTSELGYPNHWQVSQLPCTAGTLWVAGANTKKQTGCFELYLL